MISCLYDDLSDGEALNLSEKGQTVEIGNLVFLGANNKEGLCSDGVLRKAISAAVDREMLVDRVYASKAKAADLPFHPDYYKASKYEAKKLTTDEARNLLETSGLTKNAAGYYGNEEQSVLKLLYNSENAYRQQMAEMLKQQLANLGLELELQGLPYEEYMATLKAGDFDLYIGELAIDDSMDIRRLIQPGNGYGYGNMAENSLLSVYNSYQQGNVSVELFLSVYEQNMPMIPLLYRQGLIVCHEQLQEIFSPQPDRAFAEVCLQVLSLQTKNAPRCLPRVSTVPPSAETPFPARQVFTFSARLQTTNFLPRLKRKANISEKKYAVSARILSLKYAARVLWSA
jgi:ABC-type oligopeptide transport system substrate-binding subunit